MLEFTVADGSGRGVLEGKIIEPPKCSKNGIFRASILSLFLRTHHMNNFLTKNHRSVEHSTMFIKFFRIIKFACYFP